MPYSLLPDLVQGSFEGRLFNGNSFSVEQHRRVKLPTVTEVFPLFDGSGFLLWILFLLLILLLFGLLLVFAFLLFLALSLVFFSAFVTHGVTPFHLTFSVSRSLWHNKLEVGGIEQA